MTCHWCDKAAVGVVQDARDQRFPACAEHGSGVGRWVTADQPAGMVIMPAAATERAEILALLADPATVEAVGDAIAFGEHRVAIDALAAVADLIAKRGESSDV